MKYNSIQELNDDWRNCRRCQLWKERTQVCLGHGNPNADIMIIGEGPGRFEDTVGVPFVGESGRLLNVFFCRINEEVAFDPDLPPHDEDFDHHDVSARLREHFYMSNATLCWNENSKPTPQCVDACREHMIAEVYLVDPVLLIALGAIAINSIMSTRSRSKIAILKERGRVFVAAIPGVLGDVHYPVMAALHPAFLLRQADEDKKDGYFHKTYYDLLTAVSYGFRFSNMT